MFWKLDVQYLAEDTSIANIKDRIHKQKATRIWVLVCHQKESKGFIFMAYVRGHWPWTKCQCIAIQYEQFLNATRIQI